MDKTRDAFDVVFEAGGGRLTVGGSLADAVRVAEDAEGSGRRVRWIMQGGYVRLDWSLRGASDPLND